MQDLEEQLRAQSERTEGSFPPAIDLVGDSDGAATSISEPNPTNPSDNGNNVHNFASGAATGAAPAICSNGPSTAVAAAALSGRTVVSSSNHSAMDVNGGGCVGVLFSPINNASVASVAAQTETENNNCGPSRAETAVAAVAAAAAAATPGGGTGNDSEEGSAVDVGESVPLAIVLSSELPHTRGGGASSGGVDVGAGSKRSVAEVSMEANRPITVVAPASGAALTEIPPVVTSPAISSSVSSVGTSAAVSLIIASTPSTGSRAGVSAAASAQSVTPVTATQAAVPTGAAVPVAAAPLRAEVAAVPPLLPVAKMRAVKPSNGNNAEGERGRVGATATCATATAKKAEEPIDVTGDREEVAEEKGGGEGLATVSTTGLNSENERNSPGLGQSSVNPGDGSSAGRSAVTVADQNSVVAGGNSVIKQGSSVSEEKSSAAEQTAAATAEQKSGTGIEAGTQVSSAAVEDSTAVAEQGESRDAGAATDLETAGGADEGSNDIADNGDGNMDLAGDGAGDNDYDDDDGVLL